MKKYLWPVAVLFIVTAVIDIVWNAVLFPAFNLANFGSIANVVNGAIQPQIPYVLLADALTAIGFVYFVPLGFDAKTPRSSYVGRGIFFFIILYGVFEAVNHALLSTWPINQMLVDMIAGIVQGTVMGFVLSYLHQRPAAKNEKRTS